ncbi:MAG: hypothetical protein JSS10_07615 [Verrucomicrobia bacterium]|nr:hypothetical protein [Verrucomicrobiota bacterium]
MAAKPISALNPSLSELCRDPISLKPLTDAVQLNCYCYYNEETVKALQLYGLSCIQHDRVPSLYGNEDRVSLIVRALLQEGTSSLGKELTSTNVSGEIPEAAKLLYEKGKTLFEKQCFTEAARAFLGATLHHQGYTEAKHSLELALKSFRSSSSCQLPTPQVTTKLLNRRPLLTQSGPSKSPDHPSIYSPEHLVINDDHLP